MKKVLFFELDMEQKIDAIQQMMGFKTKYNHPSGAIWNNEEDLRKDLENDYDPNEHFSFYTDGYNEVSVKIG